MDSSGSVTVHHEHRNAKWEIYLSNQQLLASGNVCSMETVTYSNICLACTIIPFFGLLYLTGQIVIKQ